MTDVRSFVSKTGVNKNGSGSSIAHMDSSFLSRRRALQLLGLGAGAGAVALTASRLTDSLQARQRPTFSPEPGGPVVRTILGDLNPKAIAGATLMHEHLGTGGSDPRDTGTELPDPTRDAAWMLEELTAAHKAGLGCIVAAQTSLPAAANVAYLERLSRGAGLHIVAAGSYYNLQSYPQDVSTKSEDQIADDLVRAASSGRFGAFGEFGLQNNTPELDPLERKVFRAVAKAQVRTGLPIFTHCNYATGERVSMDIGLRQLDVLEAAGARPASVAIGHMCCLDDPMVSVAKRVAARGAFVAFDRVTRQQQWVPDAKKARMVAALVDAGLGDRLLISSDYIGRINTSVGEVNMYPGPLHAREGGPGYARPLLLFVPHLRKVGLDDVTIGRLTMVNPRQFLSFAPIKG